MASMGVYADLVLSTHSLAVVALVLVDARIVKFAVSAKYKKQYV